MVIGFKIGKHFSESFPIDNIEGRNIANNHLYGWVANAVTSFLTTLVIGGKTVQIQLFRHLCDNVFDINMVIVSSLINVFYINRYLFTVITSAVGTGPSPM